MVDASSEALLAELERRGPVGVPALAETLESHPITVDRLCSELQTDGYVYRTSSSVYDITVDGRAYLDELDR